MTSASSEGELCWGPSALALSITTCAAAALAAAVIGGRPELIAFAAPLLGVLVSTLWQRPTAHVRVTGEPKLVRCFETEVVEIAVTGEPVGGSAGVRVSSVPIDGMEVETVTEATGSGQALKLSAVRWGRYPVEVRVDATAPSGLLTGTTMLTAAEVHVYPLAAPQATRIPRTELPDRLGTHLTRHRGPGVEFADVRAYVPGDQLRAVNWAVSARRGRLHVTERLTDRAADVIVLIDTYLQAPGPASNAIDRAVRGATQVAQTALRLGDRTGIIGLGTHPRWLGADIGRRQFYRIIDTILDVGDGYVTTKGSLAPRAAVPAGAIIVAFSTMLDTQFALALIDLRKRGHTVVAVDVLHGAPFQQDLEPMIARMWRLERSAMYRDMSTVGVDVIAWSEGTTLDQVMGLVPDQTHRHRSRV